MTGNWSAASVGKALKLVSDQLSSDVSLGRVKGAAASEIEPRDNGWSDLTTFLERLRPVGLPTVPATLPSRVPEPPLAREARAAARCLSLQSRYALADDGGLLRDTQSLLFLLVAEFTLPALPPQGLQAEHDLLANVLWYQAVAVWSDRPAHQQFLLGTLFGRLEQHDAARHAFRQAVLLTSPADHDFLSKAQTYWFSLLDAGDFGEARRFLLWACRVAREDDVEELGVMLDETFREAQRAQPRVPN